ncbi:DivIVA domain-containing protein [uncultured Megasphaera sp.]|uniref:DivIVA domain-containing protein n=1 Tax=uncultured Megasphaera sp. TaxID=165188 RepID=UPI0026584401|nr:DivIVA domain-containing protein [uncultured Megasphaera sp.]
MLTPMDIHNKEFKRGFRGYSEEDVDAFMDDIASDYEKVYREYCELKEKCDKLQDKLTQYEKMEATMNSTLMLAQQTAENVKVTARKEADLILQEASNKKKKMLDETTMSLQASQQELDKVKSQTRAFRAKCRAILTSQLRLLDDMVIDGESDGDTGTETETSAAPAPDNTAKAEE